jgi:hypothetical protein
MIAAVLASSTTDFRLVWQGWLLPATLSAAFLLLALFYERIRRVDDGRIAETLHETAILIAYGPPAAAVSYLILAPALPLQDQLFTAIDAALGFSWLDWHAWVQSRPSSLPHIAVLLIFTGLTGRTNRSRELNALLIATSLPIVMISGLVPAAGALAHHGVALEKAVHLAHFEGLREGVFRVIDPRQLEGIITFPSFHTAIALILVWVARGLPIVFWPTVVLAAGQLVSIPTEGGHYLVDMLGGATITIAAIALLRHPRPPGPSAPTSRAGRPSS